MRALVDDEGRAELGGIDFVGTERWVDLTAPRGAEPDVVRITAADLPKLRGWAINTNPMFKNGLSVAAGIAKADVDAKWNWAAGKPKCADLEKPNCWNDDGSTNFIGEATEAYAEFFAFMSLVDPSAANRTHTRATYLHRFRYALCNLSYISSRQKVSIRYTAFFHPMKLSTASIPPPSKTTEPSLIFPLPIVPRNDRLCRLPAARSSRQLLSP